MRSNHKPLLQYVFCSARSEIGHQSQFLNHIASPGCIIGTRQTSGFARGEGSAALSLLRDASPMLGEGLRVSPRRWQIPGRGEAPRTPRDEWVDRICVAGRPGAHARIQRQCVGVRRSQPGSTTVSGRCGRGQAWNVDAIYPQKS
jgi:hypothetical protein